MCANEALWNSTSAAKCLSARSGSKTLRIGLAVPSSKPAARRFLLAAEKAMSDVPSLCIKPLDLNGNFNAALAAEACEAALITTQPLPCGICTVHRLSLSGREKPLFLAGGHSFSSSVPEEEWILNALYGQAVAKACGLATPRLGLINLRGAPAALRALKRLRKQGLELSLGVNEQEVEGSLLCGADLLRPEVDVAVCDSLTGTFLVSLLSTLPQAKEGNPRISILVGDRLSFPLGMIEEQDSVKSIAASLVTLAGITRSGLSAAVKYELERGISAGLYSRQMVKNA